MSGKTPSGWIRRLLSPRWQHPDAEKRREAAQRLDATRPEDHRRLETLARDPDARVRQSALSRLADPQALLAMLEDEASPELTTRLTALLVGHDGDLSLAHRLALVERLSHPRLLNDIAMQGDNQQLRLTALARITDETALLDQACENGIAAVRRAAADRIDSESGLRELARRARRDKQIQRLAREALNRRRADAAQAQAAHEKRERLLSALEAHVTHAWEPLYAGRYRHLTREWESLKDLPSAEHERRYQDAALACRKVISDHEAHQQAAESAHQQRENDDETRLGLIESLEEGLAGLRQHTRLTGQDMASLRAQKRLLDQRWAALSDRHPPRETLRARHDQALADYHRLDVAWSRLEQHAATLERALTDHDRDRLVALLETIAWPSELPPTDAIAQARAQLDPHPPLHGHEASTAGRDTLERDLATLEEQLKRGAFKAASRLHQQLRQQLATRPEQERRGIESRLKRLGAQLAELRDWRGFVAAPKREQLCEAIEALTEDGTLAAEALDRRHRRLVQEWKALGDAAATHELSRRFRQASDRLHERLAPWREQQQTLRIQNLETRRALCDQLETLLTRPDPEADPDALREIRDKAREQWRRCSPVPRPQAQTIGRRFATLSHDLQNLIDRRAREIAAAKRALIQEARTLSESAQPASRTARDAKGLQRRWRALGRAPKGEEQALWREFRDLCDEIFARREAEHDDQAARAKARLDAMQAVIDRLDAWQPSSSRDQAVLDEASAEIEALKPLPSGRRTEGMRKRWAGIVRARRERLARLAVHEEIRAWQSLQPLLSAHLDADRKALDGLAPREVVADEVLAGETLAGDMLKAHQARNDARRHPPAPQTVTDTLTRLRVHLALLAGSGLAHQDEPLRLAIQVERLNESLGQEASRAEELHGVLCALLATGPVPAQHWAREALELDALLHQMLPLPPP
ncbi:DUF349 domain-containing protein [Halomonas sp. YLGW01]|uniref:DUF349 domain-containing protein n=1 Tax=Halomonas sp. YLGW01 TaxID=2773308 RepID=UPI00177EA3EC|nr:DUF349 domain-containing protein [Halomonas sp. YLGW01]